MKIRADIAALIHAGHPNGYIAAQLGCHRTTVARARRALTQPPADQLERLERLYAEAVPTGRVRPAPGRQPTSAAQQAANRAALLAALRAA